MAEDNRSLIELPQLNLEVIFTKLPLRSLLVCCSISKSLLNLIKNDSDFARKHLAKSEPQLMIQSHVYLTHMIDLDTDTDTTSRVEVKPSFNTPLHRFHLTDSCNGLLLLESMITANDTHRCMLYNPVTGEYTLLPVTATLYIVEMSALFYCPKTNQFEVLCTFFRLSPDSDSDSNFVYSESDSMGEIYVGGSDSWESLGNIPFSPRTVINPALLEKTVHWICADESVPSVIVFFNFGTHEFGEIAGPAHVGKIHVPFNVSLVVLGNCLSIFDSFSSATNINVWVMKEYGVKDSWVREFVIDTTAWGIYSLYRCFMPVICRNNGEVVMVSARGHILFYDLLKKKGRIVNYPPLQYPWST